MLLVQAGNPSWWTGPTGNNTYLLTGSVPTLIDAGVGNPDHLDAIRTALGSTALALVLITHSHTDHVAGVAALRERWPGVDVRQFGVGSHPLQPDERVRAGDGDLVVVHTPGHSPDHCCFARGGDVFCGDLARIGGTVVIPASRGGDMADYLASLRKVRALEPSRLLPAHGPTIDDPRTVIDDYLSHRLAREREIVASLEEGGLTPSDVVARVYDRLPDALLPAAAESVLAHLVKLRNEGRAVEHGGLWRRA